jgi:hypothetical protein
LLRQTLPFKYYVIEFANRFGFIFIFFGSLERNYSRTGMGFAVNAQTYLFSMLGAVIDGTYNFSMSNFRLCFQSCVSCLGEHCPHFTEVTVTIQFSECTAISTQ